MFLEKGTLGQKNFQSEISTNLLTISTFSPIFFKNNEILNRVKEFFKVNWIYIPDYQYCLDCTTKRMIRLTFDEKKFVFQLEISTFSLIIFSKTDEMLSGQGFVSSEQNWYHILQ